MGFPDQSFQEGPTFKGRRKVCRGAGARGESWVGCAAASPLSGRSRRSLRYLERGGAWESLCLLLAERPMGGAGGRALRLFPRAVGKRPGLHVGAAGRLRRPLAARGARRRGEGGEEAGGRAGAGGARPPRRGPRGWRGSGAGARPGRGSADSGAAGAGGGGGAEAAGKEAEAGVAPARRAWGARRPGRCCWCCCRWVSARGAGGPRGGGGARRGAAWGAAGAGAAPGAGSGCAARAARRGGGPPRGLPEQGENPARPRARCRSPRRQAEPRPGTCGGEWPAPRRPQPSLPVGRREPGSP